MGIEIVITDAGRAEIINAENTGTAPVLITEIGVGSGEYTPLPTQTALQNEIKRISTIGGLNTAPDTIHVSASDDSNDEYSVYEFGLYTQSGTLFAVYSQTTGEIVNKAAASGMMLAADIIFSDINAESISFGSTNFSNPNATIQTKGVAELARTDLIPVAGGGQLEANKRYLIMDDSFYFLPETTILSNKSSVKVCRFGGIDEDTYPKLNVFGGDGTDETLGSNGETIEFYNQSTGVLEQESPVALLNIMPEIAFLFNETSGNWEL